MINQVVILDTVGNVIYQAADAEFAQKEARRFSNDMAHTTLKNYTLDVDKSTLQIDRRTYAGGTEVSKEITTVHGDELEVIVTLLAKSGLLPQP